MIDWGKVRKHKYADEPAPDGWPKELRPISQSGLSLFGIGQDGQIYWGGQKLVTERRLATYECFLATLGAAAAVTVTAIEVGRSIGWGAVRRPATGMPRTIRQGRP